MRNATYRLLRQGKVMRYDHPCCFWFYISLSFGQIIHEGPIIGMKQGIEDITAARKETECGISFSVDPEFEAGDTIQCFTRKQTSQKLMWNLGF